MTLTSGSCMAVGTLEVKAVVDAFKVTLVFFLFFHKPLNFS